MASNTQMQKTQTQAIALPDNPVTALFKQFDSGRFNVLAPITHMATLPEGTRLSVTEIRVDGSDASKDTFKLPGSNDRMLSKVTLDKIAGGAGVSWIEEKRIDDHKHPHYVEMFVRGRVTDFDGTVREVTGTKAVDLREDAGGEIMGKDLDEIVSKARSNNRDPSRQVMEARKFIAEIAASKARNRAIATLLGIKRSYSPEELRKPFIVPKLTLDTAHPMAAQVVMAQMAGAVGALFGSAVKPVGGPVIDAHLESSNTVPADDPTASPAASEVGAESSPAPSAPASEAPPMDDPPGMGSETGEVVPPTVEECKQRTQRAYARIKRAAPKFSDQAWLSLVKSAAGSARYADLTWAGLDAIDQAVTAYIDGLKEG